MSIKMSKSGSTDPNIQLDEIAELKSRIAGLESEVKYWKLRHDLLKKYPDVKKETI